MNFIQINIVFHLPPSLYFPPFLSLYPSLPPSLSSSHSTPHHHHQSTTSQPLLSLSSHNSSSLYVFQTIRLSLSLSLDVFVLNYSIIIQHQMMKISYDIYMNLQPFTFIIILSLILKQELYFCRVLDGLHHLTLTHPLLPRRVRKKGKEEGKKVSHQKPAHQMKL